MSEDSERLNLKRGKLEEIKKRISESMEKEKRARAQMPEKDQTILVRVLDQLAGERRKHEEILAREIFELKTEVQKIFSNDQLTDLGGASPT
jgi:polyhydroxyalkanoate synthesis regulator phasin